jgi:Transposase DDE domain group 1
VTHDTRWDHGLRVAAEADGLLLAGWLVIDLDGTLITAHSDKQGAAPTFKKGYGFHPLAAWLANTPRAWRCCCGRATPATGWRYSIIVTNIPATGGIPGVPGSHHAQFIDVLHREHAVVED